MPVLGFGDWLLIAHIRFRALHIECNGFKDIRYVKVKKNRVSGEKSWRSNKAAKSPGRRADGPGKPVLTPWPSSIPYGVAGWVRKKNSCRENRARQCGKLCNREKRLWEGHRSIFNFFLFTNTRFL